ncbi:GNAT family N-acetyltransferase [Nocardioides pocheonensis]|uniref:GNAT family N-acetyltransferase n=1 Tax=Nocardioides pocheonensis TaxID=661485 RepID=A0A3N0GKM6_9ACTN|nr:GNAT family N-acetyltransferase [Nocardioides pocheonensis]RNM12756.1 GNAT family N-acetyltransferase [Nocardioides pocheonensis]
MSVSPAGPASRCRVRPATAADAAALAEVAAATFVLACPPGMPPESVAAFVAENLTAERFVEYVEDTGRAVLVAEEDAEEGAASGTRAVGYAMLVHGEPYDENARAVVRHRPTTELSKIYVLPDAHGGGVARALLDAALVAAREVGAAGIWLGTNQANVRAQRFYLKSGFERIGTKRFWVGDHWEDDFVFERPL